VGCSRCINTHEHLERREPTGIDCSVVISLIHMAVLSPVRCESSVRLVRTGFAVRHLGVWFEDSSFDQSLQRNGIRSLKSLLVLVAALPSDTITIFKGSVSD